MTALLLVVGLSVNATPGRDFDTEIMPVFTKAGCNAGACHGAAAGRGGFHLSLFGSDPAGDYETIVTEFEGRRINLAKPAESLLLRKPTAQIKHGGGVRFNGEDEAAKRMQQWIAQGAFRAATPRRLLNLEVTPTTQTFKQISESISVSATATFSDGLVEDVTQWTVFWANDPAAVEVEEASARILRPGQHLIMARYLGHIVPIRLTLPFGAQKVNLTAERRANFIDGEILTTLESLRLPVSPICDDATFLRRVRIDLTGRLPNVDETRQFTADSSSDKRKRLVSRLLSSDDFVEYWTYQLATLLRNRPLPSEKVGAIALHDWLADQLRKNRGLDGIAKDLVVARGDSQRNGPAWFWRLTNDARSQAELISQVFLGVRIQCANCHNHPLDRWTQDDYHGLAAMFARMERGRNVMPSNRGDVTNPRTAEQARPQFPGVTIGENTSDLRQPFADWLTSPDNPYFAKAMVNRLWKAMFGRGLVEPVDDLRETNPATHPALLDKLATDFVSHGYDIRRTFRLIGLSTTYQRSSISNGANRDDDRFYSHSYERPLPPEVLADAWADVTGVTDQYGDEPRGTRAIALKDPTIASRTLDLLGRCSRTESCVSSASSGGGLPAMLNRINGESVNRKLSLSEGRLHRMIAAGKSNDEIIAEFFIHSLGRSPNEREQKVLASPENSNRSAWLEDVIWALLNSRQFTTNH